MHNIRDKSFNIRRVCGGLGTFSFVSDFYDPPPPPVSPDMRSPQKPPGRRQQVVYNPHPNNLNLQQPSQTYRFTVLPILCPSDLNHQTCMKHKEHLFIVYKLNFPAV